MSKKLFISYKHESKEHKKWVKQFATHLRLRGLDAKLDEFEVGPGDSFSDYMTKGIREADHTLFIVTPASVDAVESGKGALAFELQISNAMRMSTKPNFIIPILRAGDYTSSYLTDHRYIDFRDDDNFDTQIDELCDWLLGRRGPPPIHVNRSDPESIESALPILEKLTVLGFASDHPGEGEEGRIDVSSQKELKYRRRTDYKNTRWDGPWNKDFYQWDLEWSKKDGITCRQRSCCSPD